MNPRAVRGRYAGAQDMPCGAIRGAAARAAGRRKACPGVAGSKEHVVGLELEALASGFAAQVREVDLSRIEATLAEAIMDAMAEHALLLFRRQSLHDEDIFRVCSAFGPVEEQHAHRQLAGGIGPQLVRRGFHGDNLGRCLDQLARPLQNLAG